MAEPPSKRSRPTTPAHPGLRKAFLVAAGVMSILMAGGAAYSIAAINHFDKVISTSQIPTGQSCKTSGCLRHVGPCVDKICNFLVLGSDSRQGLGKQAEAAVQGQRADTIMLVHVDAPRHRTVVLSIPRDLRVDIPGHGTNKINTAFSYGPDVMVQAVTKLTGMRINHYVEVNFIGFQSLVNALHGVPICINKPMHDQLSGLNLPHAGCYNLGGAQALAFVRARHVEGDLIPDFSRIARQQLFLRALVQKTLSFGSVFNVPKLIEAAKKNLRFDKGLNLYSLQDLTRTLGEVGQKGVDFRSIPGQPVTLDGVDYVQAIEPQTSILLRRIRTGAALGTIGKGEPNTPISPASITVRIFDASSGGKAEQVASYLEKAGFSVLPVETAPSSLRDSELIWAPGHGPDEAVVSSYLNGVPVHVNKVRTAGADITIVVAAGFNGVPS